ncbi:MAG: phosphate regulon sensor histidine kinase PhoR [Rhodocyclaceae bacterium]
MKQVWIGAFAAAVVVAAVSVALGRLVGTTSGWAFAVAAPTVFLMLHLRNMVRLIAWADSPMGTPVPGAKGAWGWAFAALARRARAAQGQRRQLSQTLERFLDAAQAMPDGVLILGPHHEIEWLNTAAQAQFGLRLGQDRGYPLTNLVRQPDFIHYLNSGTYVEPLVIRSGRGAGQVFSVQIINFGDQHKLVMSRDVTHLERLETMRRDFVANVSHELKTPLTVVRGFVEMVADGLGDMKPDEVLHYLGLAEEQAQRMQRLVDDLLTLSELETGTPPSLEEHVDIRSLVTDVAADAEALSAGRHTVTVWGELSGCLLGSGRELRSALGNLASNAVRYTPPGGTIDLCWEVAADGAASFSVRDNGIGIEASHLPRLTERFYRADRGRSRESGGTGLGLAIVKHVLTRHQAVLDIRSEPGAGSTFTVNFPAGRFAPAAAASPSPRLSAG